MLMIKVLASEDCVDTRSRRQRRFTDSRDDGGENGSEARERVIEVEVGDGRWC